MSTAIPPAPTTALPVQAGNAAPVNVAVVSDPAVVKTLPDGAMVEAVAQGRAAKGIIEALTANGTMQLKAPPGVLLPPIPDGAKLLFQVMNAGAEAQLRLLAINGRPLGGGLPLGNGPMPAGAMVPGGALPFPVNTLAIPAAGLSMSAAQPGVAPAGTVLSSAPLSAAPLGLSATIIRPAGEAIRSEPGLLTAGLPADLPAGTKLIVRIAGLGPAPAPVPPIPLADTQPPVKSAAPGPVPAAMPATPTTVPAAALLSGTVLSHPPGGQAVVRTPVGTLALPTQYELPSGTPVTLEVVGKPVLPPPQAPLPAATATSLAATPPGLTPAGWPALSEAIQVLSAAGTNPQAMEQMMRAMPQAGARLAASMALFAGALRNGEGRTIIGEAGIKGLEKAGRKDLVERLRADLDSLSADAARPLAGGDWRGMTMPYVQSGFVDPIRLYVRGESRASARNGAGNTNTDQRFVLDFKLSRLGRLQMDGLVRRDDKLFDLIIRTGEALPQQTRHDILAIFGNASEMVGTKGSVSFQSGGRWLEFPPLPPPPTRIEA